MLQKVAHCLKLPSFVVHLQHEQTWTPKQGNLVCTTFARKWSSLRYLCFSGLALNAGQLAGGTPVDEFLALRMVQLTVFVLEACPPEQAMAICQRKSRKVGVPSFQRINGLIVKKA